MVGTLDFALDGKTSSSCEVDQNYKLTGNVVVTVWDNGERRYAVRFEPKSGLLVIRILRCGGSSRAIAKWELTLNSTRMVNKQYIFRMVKRLMDAMKMQWAD